MDCQKLGKLAVKSRVRNLRPRRSSVRFVRDRRAFTQLHMELVKYPDPRLFKKSVPVAITKELRDFIDQMFLFIKNELTWGNPVGLAAPQVGKNVRVFIAQDNVYINPELTPMDDAGTSVHEEGCYSLERDRFDYKVTRYNEIVLKWQNKKGKWRQERIKGLRAQVIQHEYDHLEGRLCSGQIIREDLDREDSNTPVSS